MRCGVGEPTENKCDGAYDENSHFTGERRTRRCKFAEGKTEDDGREDNAYKERDAHSAGLLVHNPQEPGDGGEQQHAHHFLERYHPLARFREHLQHGGEDAHQQVGEREPEPCGGKEQKEHGCRCGKGESHRGPEERSRTRRAQKDEQRSGEERPDKSRLVARGVHLRGGRSREPDFKDPEEAHRECREDDGHEGDETRALELHSPARGAAAGLDGGNDSGENPEACEDACGRRESEREQALAGFARLLDETEELEREHRQYARHQVQDDAPEQREEQQEHYGGGAFVTGKAVCILVAV